MKLRYVVLILLVFGVGFAAGQGVPDPLKRDRREPAPSREPAPPPPRDPGMVLVPAQSLAPLPEGLSSEERRDIDVFRRASVSVVYITSLALRRDLFTFDVQGVSILGH